MDLGRGGIACALIAARPRGAIGERDFLNRSGRKYRARPCGRGAAFRRQSVKIDVGGYHPRGKQFATGQKAAVLGNDVIARENQVRCRLALPCVSVRVGAIKARALTAHQIAAVTGLPDDLVRGAGIQDNGRARQRHRCRRRFGHPQVLADLDTDDHARAPVIRAAIHNAGPKRHATSTGNVRRNLNKGDV